MDAISLKPIREFQNGVCYCTVFSPSGDTIVSAGDSGVHLWDIGMEKCMIAYVYLLLCLTTNGGTLVFQAFIFQLFPLSFMA